MELQWRYSTIQLEIQWNRHHSNNNNNNSNNNNNNNNSNNSCHTAIQSLRWLHLHWGFTNQLLWHSWLAQPIAYMWVLKMVLRGDTKSRNSRRTKVELGTTLSPSEPTLNTHIPVRIHGCSWCRSVPKAASSFHLLHLFEYVLAFSPHSVMELTWVRSETALCCTVCNITNGSALTTSHYTFCSSMDIHAIYHRFRNIPCTWAIHQIFQEVFIPIRLIHQILKRNIVITWNSTGKMLAPLVRKLFQVGKVVDYFSSIW